MKKLVALILAVALCLSLGITAFAVDAPTALAELDKQTITSGTEQEITLTLKLSKEFGLSSVSYLVDLPSEFSLVSISSGTDAISYEGFYNLSIGKVSWYVPSIDNAMTTVFSKIVVCVPSSVAAGTYNIGVKDLSLSTYDFNNDRSWANTPVSATLTVKPAPVHVSGVSLDKTSISLTAGDSEALTATVSPDNADDKDVTWSTSDPAVATVSNGVVKAVGAGTATITVTTADGGKTATCAVTVSARPVPITGIALTDTQVSVGGSVQLTPRFTPADTTQRDVMWSSADETIATVDANGRVRGRAAGKTYITVTSAADRSITATCAVTVTPAKQDEPDTDDIDPILIAIAGAGLPFRDVSFKDYYYDAVKWAVDNDITSGVSRFTFDPDAVCTRAQVVTFLWRAAGCPRPSAEVSPFTDVHTGDYFYNAVLWAVENGITNGTSATTFSPNATVTRAQVVTLLWRAQGQPAAEAGSFRDVSGKDYFARAVDWAFAKGITTGVSSGAFGPAAACTRAQIVTFLYRAN